MAARENQGLQIGLIILVMLTVILLVAVFLVFRSYQDAYAKMEAANKEANDARNALSTAVAELAETAKLMGAPGESPKIEDVKAFFDADLKKYGGDLPAEKQAYHPMLEHYALMVADLNKRLVDEHARFETVNAEYERKQQETIQKLADNQKLIDSLQQDLKQEQAAFKKQKDEIDANRQTMLADRTKQVDAAREAQTKLDKAEKDYNKKNSDLQNVNRILAIQLEKDHPANLEAPDGRVTQVYAGTRTVYLNVGSADGVPRQATFSVYPRGSHRVSSAERKGMLEVYRVVGAHHTEARITDEKPADPILPGDEIYSPVWTPGRHERFALAGLIDIDDDGQSDLPLVRDLILLNGGQIDAVLDEKGQSPQGQEPDKMTIDTRFLIVGEDPSESANAAELTRRWSLMRADAQAKGVRALSVEEFLDYLGYRPQERTVALGSKLDEKEFVRRRPGTRLPGAALYDVNKHRRSSAPNSGPLPGTKKRAIDELPSGLLEEVLSGRPAAAPAPAAAAAPAAQGELQEPAEEATEPSQEGDELFPAEADAQPQ